MSTTAGHEIEVKLRGVSLAALQRAGFVLELLHARHFEDNRLLDAADKSLSQSETILRVRATNTNGQVSGALTFKGKAASDAPASQFKARTEIETSLGEPENALALLQQLGFRTWFRYQKYRTVYQAQLPSGAPLHVMFDETPLGEFLELEGEEHAIAEAVALLGVTPADYILESYLVLQARHCHAQGKALEDLVFHDALICL